MCYLVNVVELKSWTHLFVDDVHVLHEAQVSEFYYNAAFVEDGSLNSQVGNKRFHLDEKNVGRNLEGAERRDQVYSWIILFKGVCSGVWQTPETQ